MEYVESKDPDEVKDYAIDFTNELATGEQVSTATWIVSPVGELTLSNNTIVGGVKANVFTSSGVAGKDYILTCHVTTNAVPPRQFDKSIIVPVLND